MKNKSKEKSTSYLQSVKLTFEILREIATIGSPIGVTELSRRLNENKATVHRHLLTLKYEGMLAQTSDDKYHLGWSLFNLGIAAANQHNILDIAKPEMEKLSKKIELSVILGLRNHHHIVVLESIDSIHPIAVVVKTGLKLPACQSSSGRVMLAFSEQSLLAQVLNGLEEEKNNNLIIKRLQKVKEQGYDYAEGESAYGISGIAAPILNENGRFLAVLSIIGTQAQIGSPPKKYIIDNLLKTTKLISKLIK